MCMSFTSYLLILTSSLSPPLTPYLLSTPSFFSSNLSYSAVNLRLEGVSAVGPFCVLNPVKTLEAGEFKKIVIECCTGISGLFTEVLELKSADHIGGHCIRINLRAQGTVVLIFIPLPPLLCRLLLSPTHPH